jgi:hypothetical protein
MSSLVLKKFEDPSQVAIEAYIEKIRRFEIEIELV